MNPYIDRLLPYPFERLNALLATLTPNAARERVSLSIGEPKHAAPDFVVGALTYANATRQSLATYPPTRGSDELRTAIAGWINRRFGVTLDPATQVLPVNGTREALFSFGQAVLSGSTKARVLMPNPFWENPIPRLWFSSNSSFTTSIRLQSARRLACAAPLETIISTL